jgi:hypothetical protein
MLGQRKGHQLSIDELKLCPDNLRYNSNDIDSSQSKILRGNKKRYKLEVEILTI